MDSKSFFFCKSDRQGARNPSREGWGSRLHWISPRCFNLPICVRTQLNFLPLGSSSQCQNSLWILSGSLHRCRFQKKVFFIFFFLRNWKLTSNTFLLPGTDVTQIVNQTGCTVLTLMGITLEKQKQDKTLVSTYQYQSMLALLLRHSLLDKRLINTRPIGHEVSCHGCTKVANEYTSPLSVSESVSGS